MRAGRVALVRSSASLIFLVVGATACAPAASRGDLTYEEAVQRSGLREPVPGANSPAAAETYQQWRARRIVEIGNQAAARWEMEPEIRTLATRAVEERRPRPSVGAAMDRAMQEELTIARRAVDRQARSSPAASEMDFARWRDTQIRNIASTPDGDIATNGRIRFVAERTVEERSPPVRGSGAIARATREEEESIRAEIARIQPQLAAGRQAAAAATQRAASDNMAIAACNARGQAAEAMYPDRSLLRLNATIQAIQVRNACLDYYRNTGQVPGF